MRRSTAKPPPPPPTAPPTAFTLQGRAAPGLYTLGWLGSGRRAGPVLHRAADRPAGARRAAHGLVAAPARRAVERGGLPDRRTAPAPAALLHGCIATADLHDPVRARADRLGHARRAGCLWSGCDAHVPVHRGHRPARGLPLCRLGIRHQVAGRSPGLASACPDCLPDGCSATSPLAPE